MARAAAAPARAPRKPRHSDGPPTRTRPKTAPARRSSGPATHRARTATARTAPARKTSPRTAPTRSAPGRTPSRPARQRAPRRTAQPAPGALRRALLVRGQGLLDRLLRGRLWVVCIGALLAGIVFLNVGLLQLNDQIARTDKEAAAVGRENSDYRLRLAKLDSTERIQRLAEARGFVMPAPGAVRYVRSRPGDARNAAKRTIAPEPQIVTTVPVLAPGPGTAPAVPGTTPGVAAAPATPVAAAPVQQQTAATTPPAAAAPVP